MSRKFLILFCGFLFSNLLLGQTQSSTKAPIKYRLLLTTVELQNVNQDEIVITLSAFNTGRNPIDMYQFNSVPDEMEIKFEESFYRSNLSEMEDEIIASLINRNITITNGKIIRNIKFNLPSDEVLYKELTKVKKKYSRSYSEKVKTKSPKLKYKTNSKKTSDGISLFAKNNKKKNNTTDTKKTTAPVKDSKIASNSKVIDTPATTKESKDKVKKELKSTKQGSTKINTPEIAKVKTSKSEPINKNKKIGTVSNQDVKKSEIEKAKKDSYQIEQASQKEEEKAILESLGVRKKSDKKEIAFDTKSGVEESKKSYAEKSVCPDIVFNEVKIIKKTKNYITLEYSLKNIGKGPAYIGKSKTAPIAMRAFLSSSENITRGSLPLGGGFVTLGGGKNDKLDINSDFSGTLKLETKKMTRFTPYIILNFDPFNVLEECDKTNNYGNINAGN